MSQKRWKTDKQANMIYRCTRADDVSWTSYYNPLHKHYWRLISWRRPWQRHVATEINSVFKAMALFKTVILYSSDTWLMNMKFRKLAKRSFYEFISNDHSSKIPYLHYYNKFQYLDIMAFPKMYLVVLHVWPW